MMSRFSIRVKLLAGSPQVGMHMPQACLWRWAMRTELAEQEDGWSVELLAEMLARMQKQPLFDSNASRAQLTDDQMSRGGKGLRKYILITVTSGE